MDELEALAHLASIPHLGSIKIRLLIHHFGSALATLEADLGEIADFPGFGSKVVDAIKQSRGRSSSHREIESAAHLGIQIVPYSSPDYPKRLLEIPDFPLLLYIKGEFKKCDSQSIAVIGTRNMSIYGAELAEQTAQELASLGFTVVSGLARGIDTAAHKGALRKGRTIAVIGSGLGNIYPQENVSLAEEIASKGVLMSEFPLMTPPDRQNFPQRNRIVSGISMGIALIEAPLKSGAMITMEKGLSHRRKLFAFPGRVDHESFRGNHSLIKNGLAQLVESGPEIAQCFGDLFYGHNNRIDKEASGVPIEEEERHLLNQMPPHEIGFDEIAWITKLPATKLNVLIMSLMLKKLLKEFPGKKYKKVGQAGVITS